jgi:hypothetical protein
MKENIIGILHGFKNIGCNKEFISLNIGLRDYNDYNLESFLGYLLGKEVKISIIGGEEEMGEMSILDSTGDTKILWDCNKQDEIDKAKTQFEELMKKEYSFFKCDSKGNQLGEVKEFNELDEWIIAIPKTQKG